MKQLTQNLKDGKMEILDVPGPALRKGYILVRNSYSVISGGTEGKTVTDARKGYIAKARSRRKEVQMVLKVAKERGPFETWRMVQGKLEALAPLGYSTAGTVIGLGEGVEGFRLGQRVACAGAGASHAEEVSVPINLAAPVPDGVEIKHAAFATISAIALQGIRQAELSLGEICVVIGLGLIGQLTVQLLKAGGIRVIGIDVDPAAVDLALHSGADLALSRSTPGLERAVMDYSGGYGADAIIITAGTSSLDPIEFAGAIARKKGKVVIVGAVPTGFSRKNYYQKELDLRMSSSYGPGRYDPLYEEHGVDYPIGYVRWTENRNLRAYLDLLAAGRLDIEALVTHEFPLEDAPKAYDMIVGRHERFCGVVLRYKEETGDPGSKGATGKGEHGLVRLREKVYQAGNVNVGVVGAGSFAQNVILPNLKDFANFVGVTSGRGTTSRYIADKYGAGYATDDATSLILDPQVNTVFVMTRHDTHARFVTEALHAEKDVFVEKPLALTIEELEEVRETYLAQDKPTRLMVGYNRRFSPQVMEMKQLLIPGQPVALLYRINAGHLPPEHWVHDPEVGGGRIIGEGCHFIDLAMFLAGAPIVSVAATGLPAQAPLRPDTLNMTFGFANGSTATIAYYSNGAKSMPKEYLEVFSNDMSMVLEDFRVLKVFGEKLRVSKLRRQDKGHRGELKAFTSAIREGKPSPIPFEELYNTSRATFAVLESLRLGKVVQV